MGTRTFPEPPEAQLMEAELETEEASNQGTEQMIQEQTPYTNVYDDTDPIHPTETQP